MAQGVSPLLPEKPTQDEAGVIAALKERRASISFEATSMADAAAYFGTIIRQNVVLVGKTASDRKVSLNVKDVSAESLLRLMLGPDGNYAVIGKCLCVGGAKDVAAVFGKKALLPEDPEPEEGDLIHELDKIRVTFEFESTPMRDAVAFLVSLAKVNCVPVGKEILDRQVSMRVEAETLGNALRLLTGPEGNYTVIGNCLCVGAAKDVQALFQKKTIIPQNPKDSEIALYGALKEKRMDIEFEQTPLPDAVAFLRDATKRNIVADEAAAKDRMVSAALKNASLDTILRVICGPELNYGIGNEVIYLSTDENVKKMVGGK